MFTSNNVTISNSKFLNGTSWLGGGIGVTFYSDSTQNISECKNVLGLYNTEISNNTGIAGSGLYFEFQMKNSHPQCPIASITVFNCTFDANSIKIPFDNHFNFYGNGVAVQMIAKYHKNMKVQKISDHYEVMIEKCSFNNSFLINKKEDDNYNYTRLALPTIMTIVIVNANKNIAIKDCKFVNNQFSGIGVFNSAITLSGDIKITNNTGINGGGLMLCDSSYIYLSRNTTITFIDNSAVQAGGGIYAEEKCFRSRPFCFYQLDFQVEQNCSEALKTVSIVMTNNIAGYAGDHIYGGSLDNCKMNDCPSEYMFNNLFKYTPKTLSAVTSSPKKICFCSKGKPNCSNTKMNLTEDQYPGDIVPIQVAILGQLENTVPGTLLIYSYRNPPMPTPHTIGKECKNISLTIRGHSLGHEDIKIQISSDISTSETQENVTYLSVSEPLHVIVPIKHCPLGFTLDDEKYICKCDERLMVDGVTLENIRS